VHCQTPKVETDQTVPLRLVLFLTNDRPLLVQQLRLVVDEAFAFVMPAMQPVVLAIPTSAPVGIPSTLEWRSAAPMFEVLASVPYRCLWEHHELGDVSTPALALAPTVAHCRVPLASMSYIVAVTLEGPTGRPVSTVPVFTYYNVMAGEWLFPHGLVTPRTTIRFETQGAPVPDITYGQPLPGVIVHCHFGREVYSPAIIDTRGLECAVPAVPKGEYTLQIRYDRAYDANTITVRVESDSSALPCLGCPQTPVIPVGEVQLKSLEPSSGPTSGGTLVSVQLGLPWPNLPATAYCHFGDLA